MKNIPLIKPYINDSVKKMVSDVLDSGHLTEGRVTHELENIFADFTGAPYAIAVTSCTTGMEIALRALDIGEGDEVIVPDYTYPATAGVVSIVGATPVIVDVEPKTMLIDRYSVEKAITARTKAIMPVSIFGNPLDYSWINEIKRKHNLFVIEDSACTIGAEMNGQKVGSFADISVFSLHPRKFITTGEGGIITTSDKNLSDWMNSYKHFGIGNVGAERSEVCFERIGTNYKISDVLSAIGLAQMQSIDILLADRITQAEIYKRLISKCNNLEIQETYEGAKHSYQTFIVFVENRDEVMRKMREIGIEVQIGTYAIHVNPAYNKCRRVAADGSDFLKGSIYAYEHALALPMFFGLSESEQEYIIEKLKEICNEG
ncbi:MAG: DegT/DnrJ/EryC1/StrS aminotransferase family protein [Synergistaceae bacterium]|nr:DegT/DnrJ/EryC1/StrS aminotransferase family protein [Synergistaceae bacterium]